MALPAIAALAFLLGISLFVYGHAFRPGLYGEMLLALYFSSLLAQFQRDKVRAAIFTTLVLLAFYAACLVKFLVLGEGISWSDAAALDELFSVLAVWQRVLLLAVGAGLGVLLLTNLAPPRPLPAALSLLPLALYVTGSLLAPGAVLGVLESVRRTSEIVELQPWRDGPLVVAVRQLPRARAVRRFLDAPPGHAGSEADLHRRARTLAGLPAPQRNLHVIFLESFAEPLNFRAYHCPFDPVDARVRRWMTEAETLGLSATFGGQSARAEFEVFCGVPAFERLGIDFMALGGATIPCLPGLLASLGYRTIASSTTSPSFFNHETAYAAIGFEERHLAPDFEMTAGNMDGDLLSDEALYEQALRWILPALEAGKPLLSYVTTFAGHYPFDLDPRRHPPVCPDDTLAGKVANVAHYKSKAVADFVNLLEARDPESIVVVLSDHLPPMGLGQIGYRQGDYRLRFRGREPPPFWAAREPSWLESRASVLVVRMARRTLPLGIVPHYLLGEGLLDLLTGGAYCRATACFRSQPIIYRPNGMRPVYTTAEVFPRQVCEGASSSGDPLCRQGESMHRFLLAEYDALLRAGVRQPENRLPQAVVSAFP